MEFTVHVPSTYDYRFSSQRREDILDLLKKLYIIEKNSNCPVFLVDAKDLEAYTTTEKDMKKSLSRFPTSNLLCPEENLIKDADDFSSTQDAEVDYNQKNQRAEP